MAALAWGKKVSPRFASRVVQIAKRLSSSTAIVDPNWLMSCMAFETGERFSPKVKNPGSSATGLIQFMNATAKTLGTTTGELARMSAVDQLDYVEKYFLPYRGRIRSLSDCYMVILYPKAVGKPESYRLFVEGDKNYFANKGLDTDHDGSVTKAEAAAKVAQKLRRGLSAEFIGDDEDLVTEEDESSAVDDTSDQELKQEESSDPTVRWKRGVSYPEVEEVQSALTELGYGSVVGMIDGKFGGATAAAIKNFKVDRKLPGPTVIDDALQAALEKALNEGWRRPVGEARKNADDATIAKKAPELNEVKNNRLTAFITMITGFFAMLGNAVMEFFGDAWEWTTSIRSSFGKVPIWVWIAVAIAVAGFMFWRSQRATMKIREDFQTGERM